jgi:hypothetical protein
VVIVSIQGDCGGMYIRHAPNSAQGYQFEICPLATTPGYQYKLTRYDGPPVVLTAENSPIEIGSNILDIAIQNSSITLYINKNKVDSVSDSDLSSGLVGLIADDLLNPTTVTYTAAALLARNREGMVC